MGIGPRVTLVCMLVYILLPLGTEAQVLIRRHDIDATSSTGLHTVIGIGDVGIPSVVGDTRDGYHDYAVLNDSQQEVLVYNGRSDGPPYVIALTCPLGIAQYGGFGSSGDGGKNIIGTSSVPDFVIGAPMCNLHPVENHNQGAIYIIDGDTLSVTEWKLPDDETNLWFGRVVHLMRDYSAIPDGRVESSWAQMTGSALKIRLHKGDQELVTSSILRQPHRTL